MDLFKRLAAPVLFISLLFALAVLGRLDVSARHGQPEALPYPGDPERPIKNVILLIGDGMGLHQVSQAVYARKLAGIVDEPLAIELLSRPDASQATAFVSTYSADSITTDSAAAATAYACGTKARNRSVGRTPAGSPCATILDLARERGRATGIVSTSRITHATPAAFYASVNDRSAENEIAGQLLDGGRVDLALGGGSRSFLAQGSKHSGIAECEQPPRATNPENRYEVEVMNWIDREGRRPRGTDLLTEAREAGFAIACYKDQLPAPDSFRPGRDRLLGVFAGSHLPAIQERGVVADFIPSLAEMTGYAIDALDNDADGFVLIVESGLIDYAGHYNDAGTQLQETLDFDDAIRVALEYAERNPDTLLIVTADHETGGFSMSYHRKPTLGYFYDRGPVFRKHLDQGVSFQHLLRGLNDADVDPATKARRLRERFARHDQPWTLSEFGAETVFAVSYANSLETEGVNTDYPGAFSTVKASQWHGNRLGRVLAKQTHAVWSAGNHTHTPVPAFIRLPGIDHARLPGWIENTDINAIIRGALVSGR